MRISQLVRNNELMCIFVFTLPMVSPYIQYIGAPWLDPIGGAMVGYTILKAGYDICRDAMREALDVCFSFFSLKE